MKSGPPDGRPDFFPWKRSVNREGFSARISLRNCKSEDNHISSKEDEKGRICGPSP